MNFNQILKSLFGDESSRDMKLIKPLVEKVKAAFPEIQKLTNDELRAKTKEIQAYIHNSAKEQKAQIDELKSKIEDTPIDEREEIFAKIDKLDKEVLDIYEKALDEVMPVACSILKDTARRFAENEGTVVTATDFDRELAANPKNDFITIDGDKAIYHNHWTAGGNDSSGKWFTTTFRSLVVPCSIRVRLPKWLLVRVRLSWLLSLYSSTPSQVMVFTW